MPERQPFKVIVTGPARRDVKTIIRWSLINFGEAAALRYEALILQAVRDLGTDPNRPGSKELPEVMIPGARVYHLSLSHPNGEAQAVKKPRHFILYRHLSEGRIEVGRILHDSRDLDRHLPESYRVSQ